MIDFIPLQHYALVVNTIVMAVVALDAPMGRWVQAVSGAARASVTVE